MRYLYPIRRNVNDYYFGITDPEEIRIENLCDEGCQHENPVEASDCFRDKLLNMKPTIISVEPVKCCTPKCANTTTEALHYDYGFKFSVCKEHQNKESIEKICGFGFPLILKDIHESF